MIHFKGTPHVTLIDQMIDTAVKMMRESLETAVTVDSVAAQLGIEPHLAQPLFSSDDALNEAVGNYGMVQLIDAITNALVRAPQDEPRALLTAMGRAFVSWALANPDLYRFIAVRILRPRGSLSVIRRYESSLVTLVRRFLGETDQTASRRALMSRAFIVGLSDLALDDDLDLWKPDGTDRETELDAVISEFVDMLLSAQPQTAD